MTISSNKRREFLRNLCCVAAGGGISAMIPQLRMMSTALASTSALSGYRALVCVYLNGGNDSWNLVVPFDTARFNVYTASRSGTNSNTNAGGLGLPLPSSNIVDGNDTNTATNKYFLHPSMPEMTSLYNSKKVAFTVNVGTLVKPINKTDYNASSANRPPQLFSHADQTNQWHQGNATGGVVTGWGGLVGENLASQGANLTTTPKLPLALSISGANRFEVGSASIPYQMSSGGLIGMSGMCNLNCNGSPYNGARDAALTDLLSESYTNAFSGEYNKVVSNARNLYQLIGTDLPPNSSTYAPTNTFPNTGLAAQLKTVATMINLTKAKNYATRQIYFVQIGGFDLHSNFFSATNGHAALLTQVSQALNAFYTSLGTAQSEVTAFTVSDFARTLQSNGSGSDHGWGSVQMMMGGAVNGGKLYTHGDKLSGFPDQSLTATNNFSRGQMIPAIGVEQYAGTLAKWMGVSDTNLQTIFPNLHNFTTHDLGFMTA
jgi:uncharacterized protein (DUF1501 family)